MEQKVYNDRAKKIVKEHGIKFFMDNLKLSKQSVTNWYTRGVPDQLCLSVCKLLKSKKGVVIYPDFFSSKYEGFYDYYKGRS